MYNIPVAKRTRVIDHYRAWIFQRWNVMLGKKCTSKNAILHLIVRLESGLLGYYEDCMEIFCRDSTSQKELDGSELGSSEVCPPLRTQGQPRSKLWPKERGPKGKGKEHKKGQVRSEPAQTQGADTLLSGKSGTEFATISNLDAWGLWVREGQAGEDS